MNLLMSQKTLLILLLLSRTGKNSFKKCSSKMSRSKKSRGGRVLVYPLTTTRHRHRPSGDEMSSSALFTEEMLQTPRAPDYNLQTLIRVRHAFFGPSSVVSAVICLSNQWFQSDSSVFLFCFIAALKTS